MQHPLLNALLFNSIPVSKESRSALFFARTIMIHTMVSLLGSNQGLAFNLRRMQNVELSVNVYILMLPYFTFVPLELVIRSMFADSFKKKNLKPTMSKAKRNCYLSIRYIGISIYIIIVIFCIYAILNISENNSSNENKTVLGYFGRALA